jgi:hypothetical protein
MSRPVAGSASIPANAKWCSTARSTPTRSMCTRARRRSTAARHAAQRAGRAVRAQRRFRHRRRARLSAQPAGAPNGPTVNLAEDADYVRHHRRRARAEPVAENLSAVPCAPRRRSAQGRHVRGSGAQSGGAARARHGDGAGGAGRPARNLSRGLGSCRGATRPMSIISPTTLPDFSKESLVRVRRGLTSPAPPPTTRSRTGVRP